jgi:hypothetical protein
MGAVKKSCQKLAIDLGFLIGFCFFFGLNKQVTQKNTQKLQRKGQFFFQLSMPLPPTYIQAFNPSIQLKVFIN